MVAISDGKFCIHEKIKLCNRAVLLTRLCNQSIGIIMKQNNHKHFKYNQLIINVYIQVLMFYHLKTRHCVNTVHL